MIFFKKQHFLGKCFIILVSILLCMVPLMLIAADEANSLRGDIDGDNKLGIGDVAELIDHLLADDMTPSMCQQADVNNDGQVSVDDIVELIDMLLTPEVQYVLTLSQDSVRIEKGKRIILRATIGPDSVVDKTITWRSTDESIARVEANANEACIEAMAVGECDVVGEWKGVQTVCHVAVLPVALDSIAIEADYLTMRVDETKTLGVRVTPSTASIDDMIWLSSDSGVVAVDDGVLTAVGDGICDIVVRCQGLQVSCKVAVFKTVVVNGVPFEMLPVEGGSFMMGATSGEHEALSYEVPQHHVTLSDYMIGQTEVTQEQWHAVMNYTPGHFKGNPKHPVENVTWEDCQEFISKLNEMTGLNFHLPTEAQWEYAARGGNRSLGFKFAGSNDVTEVGWYYSNSGKLGASDPNYGTHDVAQLKPNELNLYDMTGNVREWCQDYYAPYSAVSQVDPLGPATGSMRLYRDGSWNDYIIYCRVAFRYPDYVTTKNDKTGLRLAL